MNAVKDALREHLVRTLEWHEAHLTLEESLKGLPAARRGKRPRGLAHSPWELLEHIRLAQRDLLEYASRKDYAAARWPEDYWPASPAPPSAASWTRSLKAIAKDRRALQALVASAPDLLADVPSRKGKTILRAVLLAIDHTAYHVGQLVSAKQALLRAR